MYIPVYVHDTYRNLHKCTDMYVHLPICTYMVYTCTYMACTYHVCTCLTFLNMYVHVKYMSIPFFQILSRWSGFQMN